jgi:MFS family permease
MSTTALTPAWYHTITAQQWKALAASALGWMLDAMDFVIYLMAIKTLQDKIGFGSPEAGLLATVTLLTSAVGGMLFGLIADKIGRTRALMATILIYSLCSLGTATAQDFTQLIIWRSVLGFGMGGEWACAAVLVSETWPAEHRGKAISIMQSGWAIGYILAGVVAALVLETFALNWHWLFVIGAAPAILVFWMRREVHEPELWQKQMSKPLVTAAGGLAMGASGAPSGHAPDGGDAIQPAHNVPAAHQPPPSVETPPIVNPFTKPGPANPLLAIFQPPLLRSTLMALLLSSAVMFAYWGLFSWVPQYLRIGADQTLWQSMQVIVPMQIGAFLGYLSFGFLAERFGRRLTFAAFLLAAAAVVPVFASLGHSLLWLILLAPLVGYAGSGYFSIFGSLLAELFPTSARGTGQGVTYNGGRAVAALAPFTIGVLAKEQGIAWALGFTAVFFVFAAGLIVFLPDRSGQQLEA